VEKKLSKIELERLYTKKSMSIREVAEFLGYSKDMVYRSLKEYGIKTRSNKRRSRLKDIDLSTLENGIKRKETRGYTKELYLDESTLRHHMKYRRPAG